MCRILVGERKQRLSNTMTSYLGSRLALPHIRFERYCKRRFFKYGGRSLRFRKYPCVPISIILLSIAGEQQAYPMPITSTNYFYYYEFCLAIIFTDFFELKYVYIYLQSISSSYCTLMRKTAETKYSGRLRPFFLQ